MVTKIKKTKTSRGRPRKEFTITAVNKNDTDVKRGRGRPKKEKKFDDSINTKISNYNKDINKISRENEKMQLEIKSTSFVSKKIKKEDNKKSDNFALGLLIFSMVLFIFSLYKTFYLGTYKELDDYDTKNNIDTESVVAIEVAKNTGTTLMKNVAEKDPEVMIGNSGLVSVDINGELIKSFYLNINNQKFSEVSSMIDNYLKNSNVFRTYYNKNRLSKFLDNLVNEKIYITNIKEKIVDEQKDGVNYYTYTIKYKIKDNNQLFQEEWETAIITKNEKKLIGSLRCTTTGCSKMPFFNPKR